MEDLTGLGKIAESVAKLADSELVIKAYDDLLADAMKVGGKALADTVKAFRLFTAPIQLFAVAQDRLAAFCDRVRAKVPEDRQQEAAPSIALPILMDLRFMEDRNPLTELYLNLLARAIDKERCHEAHPAFIKIIEQLSPDEAMVLFQFQQQAEWVFPSRHDYTGTSFPVDTLIQPTHLRLYVEHLAALNLLHVPPVTVVTMRSGTCSKTPFVVTITEFGTLFVEACIPDNPNLTSFRGNSALAGQ